MCKKIRHHFDEYGSEDTPRQANGAKRNFWNGQVMAVPLHLPCRLAGEGYIESRFAIFALTLPAGL